MPSVGDTLRRERLQRKLDLDQISRELKISRRLLDAIETDQYDLLPGSMFAKAFVRQYAGLLGLKGDRSLSRFNAPSNRHRSKSPNAPSRR